MSTLVENNNKTQKQENTIMKKGFVSIPLSKNDALHADLPSVESKMKAEYLDSHALDDFQW